MSTRANILIKDKFTEQWFYRHSDGYPSETTKTLKKFVSWLNDGLIRDNVGQSSGWLIIIGNKEYGLSEPSLSDSFSGWKVGAYEITNKEHCDIEYLYIIDLFEKIVKISDVYDNKSTIYTYDEFLNANFI